MSDMITGVINSFGGPILEQLGAKLGLPPSVVKQAVPVVVGLVVAAVARKGRSPEGRQELSGLLESAGAQVGSASLSDFIRDLDPAQSRATLQSLAGGNAVENVVGNVSRVTGIPAETCEKALGTLAPAVISQLGAQAKAKGLDAAGLVQMIQEQGESLKALGNLDYLLDDVPGIGDDIKRGLGKIFGGGKES